MSLQFKIILLVTATLAALVSGLPGASTTAIRGRRQECPQYENISEVDKLMSGLTYSQAMLLNSRNYSILPNANSFPKVETISSDEVVSSTYEALVSALDKVLRLYDFQAQLKDRHSGSESVEVMALQVVVDGLVDQTCDWIQSLGVSYSSSCEQFVCSEAGLRKLHALTSAWVLLKATFSSIQDFNNTNCRLPGPWIQNSGVKNDLKAVFNNTVYYDLVNIYI